MQITVSKLVATSIAAGLLGFSVFEKCGISDNALATLLILVLALLFVWFPETCSRYLYLHRPRWFLYNNITFPPWVFTMLGWFVLIGLPLLVYWSSKGTEQ